MTMRVKAVIADDEKHLRDYLRSLLKEVWPELLICGEAENGQQVLDLIAAHGPHVAFLDIKMPGLSGMEAARAVAGACRVVFVTAYHQYAVEAFEREAVDYLLKPVTRERLEATVERLKKQMSEQIPPTSELAAIAGELLTRLTVPKGAGFLQWLRVQQGDGVRLIPVDEVEYFKADEKYTLVFTPEGESLIRKSIKELTTELDPNRFWQIHRGTIVNASRIDRVSRSVTGRGTLKLRDRPEILTVSRRFLHLFKQM